MSNDKLTPEERRHYDPSGVEFYDLASGRMMKLVQEGHWKGWLCWKHPDGQWVSLRKATDDDLSRLARGPDAGQHVPPSPMDGSLWAAFESGYRATPAPVTLPAPAAPRADTETSAQVASGDPLLRAWRAYTATEAFANTKRWATVSAHVEGSLWAAFESGYRATHAPAAPRADTEKRPPLNAHPLLWAAYETSQRIEECGASPALTAAVTQSGKVLEMANALVRDLRVHEAELSIIDAVLARRPALSDLNTRVERIERAINVAKQADALAAECNRLRAEKRDEAELERDGWEVFADSAEQERQYDDGGVSVRFVGPWVAGEHHGDTEDGDYCSPRNVHDYVRELGHQHVRRPTVHAPTEGQADG